MVYFYWLFNVNYCLLYRNFNLYLWILIYLGKFGSLNRNLLCIFCIFLFFIWLTTLILFYLLLLFFFFLICLWNLFELIIFFIRISLILHIIKVIFFFHLEFLLLLNYFYTFSLAFIYAICRDRFRRRCMLWRSCRYSTNMTFNLISLNL